MDEDLTQDEVTIETSSEDGDIHIKDKLKELREKLAICQKERQEYLEGWQRAKADFVNARKEDERERALVVAYANERLLLQVIDTLDLFDQAFAHKESWEKVDKAWRTGVEMIYQKLLSTLLSNGLAKVLAEVGGAFDPHSQEVVATMPTDDESIDGKIVSLRSSGYALGEKIIRPAKVTLYAKNSGN